MTSIKSLADELREKIKSEEQPSAKPDKPGKPPPATKDIQPMSIQHPADNNEIAAFFEALQLYQLSGQDKLLIRLDSGTTGFLKKLKYAKAIDMNKFIAFALQYFLKQHPWLIPHLNETLKKIDL